MCACSSHIQHACIVASYLNMHGLEYSPVAQCPSLYVMRELETCMHGRSIPLSACMTSLSRDDQSLVLVWCWLEDYVWEVICVHPGLRWWISLLRCLSKSSGLEFLFRRKDPTSFCVVAREIVPGGLLLMFFRQVQGALCGRIYQV